jgi:hypothetical protein
MRIITLVRRFVEAVGRLGGGVAFAARPAHMHTARIIRLSRPVTHRTGRRPVVRWRVNPASGRLECRWIIADEMPVRGPDSSFFERFGAILAERQRDRDWN